MSFLRGTSLPVVIAVSGGTAIVASYLYDKYKESERAPPGPIALPLVGNFYQLNISQNKLPELFLRYACKYGDVFSLTLGSINCVVLNSVTSIQEALKTNANISSDRPSFVPIIDHVYECRGLVWSSCEPWQELRDCAARTLRDSSLEQRIHTELDRLKDELSQFEEQCCEFCPLELFHKASSNIVSSIVFGCRYKYSSRRFTNFLTKIRCISEVNIFHSSTFFPLLVKLPVPLIRSAVADMEHILAFIDHEVEEHKENFSPSCANDFVDAYLMQVCGGCQPNINICRKQFEVAVIDLFVCGAEPLSSALSWAILCMISYPEIQKKCQNEIEMVCEGRRPDMCDFFNLTYVRATVYEVLRRFTILPLGIPHSTQQSCTIGCYDVPCDSIIVTNINAVHLSPDNWCNPCCFDPERFLSRDCCCPELVNITDMKHFMPFGIGPRNCVGKDMAIKSLVLLFAGLLQRFCFEKTCDCDPLACMDGEYNFTFAPRPFKVKLRVHC